mgnify:CR=1 FL=1|tara:strand:+ start:163 stop:591 length:429 start_codon:yes stop_codon:yes gene_type:complete
MKNIKSVIIGFLSCVCLLLFMGQTSSNHIKAKSITLVNDAGEGVIFLGSNEQGGFMVVHNNLQKQNIYFGTNSSGNGELSIWNVLSNQSLFLGSADDGNGRLTINDVSGAQNVFIGSRDGQGFIATTNLAMETTGSMPRYKK